MRQTEHQVTLVWQEKIAPQKQVPWFYDLYDICVDDQPVGRLVFRYGTDEQLKYCGHVGYSIDEASRGHGYASRALFLLMPIIQAKGYKKMIISCRPSNMASRKTIEKMSILSQKWITEIEDPEFDSEEGLLVYEIEVGA